jgi:ethanolamine ammonia-lyase large subunit
MAVAGKADPMLGYLTTSFREHPRLRRRAGRFMASAMERRLEALGLTNGANYVGAAVGRLYASFARASGDHRTSSTLEKEGQRRLMALRERGFDLGIGDDADADARLERIYTHARRALYAILEDGVIRDACPRSIRVRTAARDRDEYLAHPQLGERLREDDARAVATLYPERKPRTQFVISDGLNADAVNEQLRTLLPMLRRSSIEDGSPVGAIDIVVQNGRVRVGYEIGGLVGAEVIVHLLGERPGTGLNTLSAYITYGRDESGAWRWSRALDHSATTAICGIHEKGKPLRVAAMEIARTVARMLAQRASGVALKTTTND